MIGDRWGVSDAETHRAYPCDEFVHAPVLQVWRGVTVAAPAARVWPWVAQLRLAPYSYDWIDNLGRRSPQQLRGLPDPVVGDHFVSSAGRPMGRVLSVEPGRQLTGSLAGVVMSYVLQPLGTGDGHTRLLMKLTGDRLRLAAPLISLGDLVMARRQLLNLRRLAEATPVAR